MDLPTYTRVFTIERRLYRIFDFELPVPVSATQLGAFLVSTIVVLSVGGLLGIPLTPMTIAPHLGLAALAAWLMCQPIAERKRPHQWLASQIRFLAEPKRLFDFCDPHEPARADLVVAVSEPGSKGGRSGRRRRVVSEPAAVVEQAQ